MINYSRLKDPKVQWLPNSLQDSELHSQDSGEIWMGSENKMVAVYQCYFSDFSDYL
jgi:hypothetical protein